MATSPPDEGDPRTVLAKQMQAWLAANTARDRITRQPERRIGERRAPPYAARRGTDRDSRHADIAFILAYLSGLPADQLLLWMDGLVLGRATPEELAVLVSAVRKSRRADEQQAPALPGKRGRRRVEHLLPGGHAVEDAALRYEWRELKGELTSLSLARQQHYGPLNQNRAGRPRSSAHRDACLTSPIGQRVANAGLFDAFFDSQPPTVLGEMAARLLRLELEDGLRGRAERARASAAEDHDDREFWLMQAADADQRRDALPAWRTLYRKIRAPHKTETSDMLALMALHNKQVATSVAVDAPDDEMVYVDEILGGAIRVAQWIWPRHCHACATIAARAASERP